jgi:hypothetical protein
VPHVAEDFGNTAKSDAEPFRKPPNVADHSQSTPGSDADELAELRKENLDLKITNRGKDYFIEQLQKEREGLLRQVADSSHQIGQLETQLRQLGDSPPRNERIQSELIA